LRPPSAADVESAERSDARVANLDGVADDGVVRPLVGRAAELARLDGAMAAATSGPGALALVTGEPGIGKSRLAMEVAATATARGGIAVWGRAWEMGAAPVFWPWQQALRALVALHTGAVRDELAAASALLDGAKGPGAERFEVFYACARALAAAGAVRPTTIILDDLHAADGASVALLDFVARLRHQVPLGLLATFRPVEAARRDDLADLIARVKREAVTIELGRLTLDEVRVLVGDAPALADAVHRASGGNPFFVDELLRVLAARDTGAGGDLLAGAAPLPGVLRAACRDHLRLVSDDCRAVLVRAAVLGRDVMPAIVAATARVPPDRAAALLSEAERVGVLVDDGVGRRRFSHVLVAEALLDELAPAERAALHADAARALASLADADPGLTVQLADLWLRAGEAGVEPGIDASVRAAQIASRQLAFEDAAAMLQRATVALEAARPADTARRSELLLARAEAEFKAGDNASGRASCLRVAEVARARGDGELLARAAVCYGLEIRQGIRDDVLRGLLDEALAALPIEDTPLRARVLARLAAVLQPSIRPNAAIDLARESIAMARRCADARVLAAVIATAGSALMDFAPASERAALHTELAAFAAAAGDRPLAWRAHLRLVFDHLERGDLVGADHAEHALAALAASFRQPTYHWPVALVRSMRARLAGDVAAADAATREAEAIAARAGDPTAIRVLAMHRFGAAWLAGDAAELDARQMALAATFPPTPISRWMGEAAVHARCGRLAAARATLARIDPDDGEHMAALGFVASWWTEAAVYAGDDALVARVYAALAPSDQVLRSWGMIAFIVDGTRVSALAALAARLGRARDAEAHATTDREVASRPGIAVPAARLVAAVSAPAPTSPRLVLRAEGETWAIVFGGTTTRIKDGRGVRMIARLVERTGDEIHALELAGDTGASDRGDAGELLDHAARDAYRRRLDELDALVEDAVARGDAARLAATTREREMLVAELSRAVGLGGRVRRAGGADERARVNVQRRIADAIRRIREHDAVIGDHLARAIRTGMFCRYDPD
jgi:hypothetical protein